MNTNPIMQNMEFLNRIELRGFVGNVRKQKVSDRTVVSFSLATDYAFTDAQSCHVIETTWHRCVAWSSDANPDLENVAKGSRVYVVGRLRAQRFTDINGYERTIYEVVASTVQLVSE